MKLHLAPVLAATLLSHGYLHAQSLTNPSFEAPAVAVNTAQQVLPDGWSGSGVTLIRGDLSPGYPLPQDGSQYVLLGASSTLSQPFALASPAGVTFRWFDSSEFNGPTSSSPYRASIMSGGSALAALDFNANAEILRAWTPRSLFASLAPGNYVIQFQGLAAPFGAKPLLDNVTIVPEPAVGTLAALVSLTLARCGRRKRCPGRL